MTNEVHKRALKIIYGDYKSNFQELLQKDNFVTIYQKKLQ